jgi:phytanoyl-CoA hydroxylase
MDMIDRNNSRNRYLVHVDQYAFYQRNGYLKVPGLIALQDIEKLASWADDLLYGRIDVTGTDSDAGSIKIPGISPDASIEDLAKRFTRVHMLHRVDATAEWGLLHPRVLDVLEALIGPDVLALQSMLFFNPPGRGGQGWHQDSFYITTYPDTLIGVWIALERADEENGCLWVSPGSNCEPIYPPAEERPKVHATEAFNELFTADNASHLDDSVNALSKVVDKYPAPISVPMEPADVLFFHAHLLHRSYPNKTKDRFRRSFVTHYCNARSWVPWNHGHTFEGDSANYLHILARGGTHLPYANPKFGTPVEINSAGAAGASQPARMMGMGSGDMIKMPASE